MGKPAYTDDIIGSKYCGRKKSNNQALNTEQRLTRLGAHPVTHENYGAGFQPLFSFLTFSWGVAPG
jgi:hypothetical protein